MTETIPEDFLNQYPGLSDWCILSMYRGSIAHGMYVPDSIDDKDVMAICVPPLDHYFGLKQYGSRGTKEIHQGEWDIVIYEARKMVALLSKANPNVLSALWLEDQFYIKKSPAGQMLIDNRYLFASKQTYHSFSGYAYSQLKKMTIGAHKGYMGEKRKALVEKFGYDTKNAAHLIRLLKMGTEFLRHGELQVTRPDASQLLEIKQGEWELERVKGMADTLFLDLQKARDESRLPEYPDMDEINKLCSDIICTSLSERSNNYGGR